MSFSEMQFRFWGTLNKNTWEGDSSRALAGKSLKEQKRSQLQREQRKYAPRVENLKRKVKNLE